VADAVVGHHQAGDAVDDAEDVPLGARLETGQAADADVRVDDRVDGQRQARSALLALHQGAGGVGMATPPAPEVDATQHDGCRYRSGEYG